MSSRIKIKFIHNQRVVCKRNPISYSVWLMPEGNVKDQLINVIHLLSTEFGSPNFDPHVTLVSSLLGNEKELLQKTEIISKKIKPFEIFFEGIAFLNEFFRSLFLKVNSNSKLQKARNISCYNLNWYDHDYIPHLSLAYGDYNKKEKQKMISSIKLLPDGFSVDHIFLAHNDEVNLKWKVIQSFPLTE